MEKIDHHIPYTKHSIDNDDIDQVIRILKGTYLTTGPEVKVFEENFAKRIGTKYAVACSSGTAALHLLALTVENAEGGNFITCPLTFVADANCAKYVGAEVKFADINLDTWNISIESIKETVDSKTKAVVVTHFAGLPAMINEIEEFCKNEGIFLIEDACHSPGATLNEKNTGTFGDAAIFSLHPAKHIAVGEGGIITTNDENLYEKLLVLRNHGLESWQKRKGHVYDIKELGFNYRMTDSEAALGNSQIKKLEESLKRRRSIANFYYKNIKWDHFEYQKLSENTTHAYHLFPVTVDEKINRTDFMDYLREYNIGATIHYPLINALSLYSDSNQKTPNSKNIGHRILSIPMYPTLLDNEVEYVVEVINSYYKS